MQISKTQIAKGVVRFVIAGSAGTVITRLVQQNVEPDEDKRFDKQRVGIGTAVLSWMIQDVVGRTTDGMIDAAVSGWQHKDEETPENVVPVEF